MVGQFTFETQDHDLACARVGADADFGVESRIGGLAVARQHGDHPTGMLAAGEVRRFDGVFENLLGVWRDDERQDPAHRDRAALLAEADDLLVDVVGAGVGQIDDHSCRFSPWASPGRYPHARALVTAASILYPCRGSSRTPTPGPRYPTRMGRACRVRPSGRERDRVSPRSTRLPC